MDLEDVLAEFQMEYFCWAGIPFGLVWVGDRTPNFTAIKKNWGDDAIKYSEPDFHWWF